MSQTVNGVTTNYVLDQAAGLTQVLADGTNTYLYGNGRIAQVSATGTDYFLSDALGSMRQLANASGSVTLARNYRPYGSVMSSVGSGTTIYGFTGEVTDSGTGLVYLRARYYEPVRQGRFITKDVWPGNYTRPQSLNGWSYLEGNPINFIDPTGHCKRQPVVGPSDCEKFVAEVQRFIAAAQSQGVPDGWIVYLLASYYAGNRITINVLGLQLLNPPGALVRDPNFVNLGDRWRLGDPNAFNINPPAPGAEEAALRYGFKRIFYDNTHHYFANFYQAWFYGSAIARRYNRDRERDQFSLGNQGYYDTAADLLVAEVAIKHVETIRQLNFSTDYGGFEGIPETGGLLGVSGNGALAVLPQLLRRDVCGDTLDEIYAEWTWPNPEIEKVIGPAP